MNRIKSLTIVILILLVLVILAIVRNSDQNLFKQDVKTAIVAAQNDSNTISPDQLKKRTRPCLLVNLGNENIPDSLLVEKTISIPFENLLDQTNRKILNEVKGDIILYSTDVAIVTKAWVILNQLGFKNLFILSSTSNSEVLNYKFEPDTTAGIETDSI